jgi:hypothetical protein
MKLTSTFPKLSALVACSLVMGAAGVLAADSPAKHRERGLIKSVDAQNHWLVVTDRKDNSEHKYQWNDQTRFKEQRRALEHGKKITAADLKQGMSVSVTYTPGGDTPTLKQVQVAPAKGERHAKATLPSSQQS